MTFFSKELGKLSVYLSRVRLHDDYFFFKASVRFSGCRAVQMGSSHIRSRFSESKKEQKQKEARAIRSAVRIATRNYYKVLKLVNSRFGPE
jgi:hypothetical protein